MLLSPYIPGNIYTIICKIDSQWEFAVWCRELKPGLANNLDRWDGEGGRREVHEGGYVGIPMADSCQCMAKPLQYCKVISLLSLHGKQMGKHWLTLFWGGSKITEDGDCSHELKRHLLLGRKAMTNLDRILKTETLLFNKGPSSQGYGFSNSHVWMWELDYKEAWAPKN